MSDEPQARAPHTRRTLPGQRSLGLDRLVLRAALDDRFREVLLRDRPAAVHAPGIRLSPLEERILLGISTPQLDELVRAAVPQVDRRGFLKAASATVAALVAAGVATGAGCSGVDETHLSCDGCRPDDSLLCYQRTAGHYWIELYAHMTLVYLPPAYERGSEYPWCFVLHGKDQTSLDAVSAFQPCADAHGVILIAPGWKGLVSYSGQMAAHVDPMLLQLRDSIACLGQPLRPPVVAGLGLGAAVAASAALFQPGVLRSAIALDGPLPEAWRSQSVVRPEERALYMATLQGTPEYARLAVAAQQLAQRGVRTKLVPLDRGAPLLPADVTSAWLWADGATSRSRGR